MSMRNKWLVGWPEVMGALLYLVLSIHGALAMTQVSPARSGAQAMTLQQQGNWRDALEQWQAILALDDVAATEIARALEQAALCQQNLGVVQQLDRMLQDAMEQHGDRWQVASAAAQVLLAAPHHGRLVQRRFLRAPQGEERGTWIDVTEQDRQQALQWMMRPLAEPGTTMSPAERSGYIFQLANTLLHGRHHRTAWQLGELTNLAKPPDYTDTGLSQNRVSRYASVQADSQPVLYALPPSIEQAQSDGERLRWALQQVSDLDTNLGASADLVWGDWLQSQFSVDTLLEDFWLARSISATTSDSESPSRLLELHTLKDDEALARLATGVKRFVLPEDFNPIAIFKRLAATNGPQARDALDRLANIQLNRRQFDRSLQYLREIERRFGRDASIAQRVVQIIQPLAMFDPTPSQPAGGPTKLSMVFRNARQVTFVAQSVDLERFLAETRRFYQQQNQGRDPSFAGFRGMHPPHPGNIQSIFMAKKLMQFVSGEAGAWTMDLEPRPGHWDRRIEIQTPLQSPGLYVVTATLDGGKHMARTCMWIHDLALVRKPEGKSMAYFAMDSRDGSPIPNANLELFGFTWNQQQARGNRAFLTKSLARKTDREGRVVLTQADCPADYQWLAIARGQMGKAQSSLGMLGFEGFMLQDQPEQRWDQVRAYGVSDRPVYRPGDTIHAKFWLGRASYATDITSTQLGNTNVTLRLLDHQGNTFWESNGTTDRFGGIEMEIPTNDKAGLGIYRFQIGTPDGQWLASELAVRLEEYRKPEYEVEIVSPQKPVQLGERFQATVQAKYYFGAPVTEADVTVRVKRQAIAQSYYPAMPWDWLFGKGYWCATYAYDWLPGWKDWSSCLPPHPWWIPHFQNEPDELILDDRVTLNSEGKASVSIDTSLAKELFGQSDHRYTITAEVRDASRRTVVGEGSVSVARQPFQISAWVDRGYYVVGDPITAHAQARTLDGQSVRAQGTVELLKLRYEKDGKVEEASVQRWNVETDDQGNISQKLQADRPGQFRLRWMLRDNGDRQVEGGCVFLIRGKSLERTSLGDHRFDALELVPHQSSYRPGERMQLLVNADYGNARVALYAHTQGGPKTPRWVRLDGKSATIEIPIQAGDQPNFFIEAFTVYDGRVHTATREVFVPPQERLLDVDVQLDKKEYRPGESAEGLLQLKGTDGKPVEGTAVVAIYDRSLENIAPDMMAGDIRAFFWKWQRHYYLNLSSNLDWQCHLAHIQDVVPWMPLGIFGSSLADDADLSKRKSMGLRRGLQNRFGRGSMLGEPGLVGGRAGGRVGGMAMRMEGMADAAAPNAPRSNELSMAAAALQTGSTPSPAAPIVRKDFADTALWLGKLDIDATGQAKLPFKMPESITSWSVRAWALGGGLRVGSFQSSTVTRKDLIVRLQAPRFLVEQDEVILSALVNNERDESIMARVRLEIDRQAQMEFLLDVQEEQSVRVSPRGQQRVDWRCRAKAEGLATLRTIATSGEETDAMQTVIPILVRGARTTEIHAGTIAPESPRSSVEINVPSLRRPDQSELTIRMSPSLAASMVDALPYLVDYPYGCTEQTLNRFLPTVMTQRLLQRMNIDLAEVAKHRNNWNASELGDPKTRSRQWRRLAREPVFDPAEVHRMVQEGISRLADMQNSDGGWGWFSGLGEQSFAHTTAVVVRGLLVARDNDVGLLPNMLERGQQWLQQYQESEFQKLQNFQHKKEPYKESPEALDAMVFQILVQSGHPHPGMQSFLFEKREALGIYGKCLLAQATHRQGDQQQTDMLRRNIEQFLVEDIENQTAFLRDKAAWWYWYGSTVESTACYLKLLSEIDPRGATAGRLVKYLLNNRKHATYWASTRDTALVLEAFADYLKATGEGQTPMLAQVYLDDAVLGTIRFDPKELFATDNTIRIRGSAIPSGKHQLKIRKEGQGPLYWSVFSSHFTLEEEILEAGLDVRVQRHYYLLEPVARTLSIADQSGQIPNAKRLAYDRRKIDDLHEVSSGSLVEVELVVESKNDYEYLIVRDPKPAAMETIESQSGYVWTTDFGAELGAYREFRDREVTFFLRFLPRGKQLLTYRVRVEAPGQFTGLPASVVGMYAPELTGSSRDFDLRVQEAKSR